MKNNNIQEDYCSFEVSKLLKEKGFKQPTLRYYFEDGEFKENAFRDTTGMDYGSEFMVEYGELLENWNDNFLTKKNGGRCFGCNKSNGYFETYSSPTHSLAIKWIRENFDTSIDVARYYNPQKSYKRLYEVGISHKDNGYEGLLQNASNRLSLDWTLNPSEYWLFEKPEEATEAALLYTLKNLI